MTDSQRKALSAFFAEAVLPVLTPLAIDVSRPFPLLSSLSLNVAVLLDAAAAESDYRLAIVQVPAGLARLVRIAGADGATFIPLEEIIRAHLAQLFPGRRFCSRRRCAWRAMPKWNSTTKADARNWSWSSAS